MLVQDTLSGALHEVPDVAGYAEAPGYGYYAQAPQLAYYADPAETMGEAYDGFGNPVGLPFLAPIASAIAPLAAKVLPGIASKVLPGIANAIPGVSQLIGNLMPGGIPRPPMPPGLQLPQLPGLPPPPMSMGMMPPSVPPGWMQSPVPYQGLAPRRRYMRCVSWPGPPGLVPVSAAQTMQPQAPAAAIVAAAQGVMPRRRYFRRRR